MRLPAINPTARRVRLVSKAAKRLPVQNNLMKAVQPRDRAERVEGLITSGATARELEAVAKVLKKRGRSKLLPLEILVVVSAFLTQDTAFKLSAALINGLGRLSGSAGRDSFAHLGDRLQQIGKQLTDPDKKAARYYAAAVSGLRSSHRFGYRLAAKGLEKTFLEAAEKLNALTGSPDAPIQSLDPAPPVVRPWADPSLGLGVEHVLLDDGGTG